MKDLFSTQADLYARFRPTYPAELYELILSHVQQRETVWDCATGNGQVARGLVAYVQKVFATDISENQLKHAVRHDRIDYSLSPAERTPFQDNSFDLITVAQAYHWLDTPAFCREATRVGRPGAIVAVWGYDLTSISQEVDPLLRHWNFDILKPFWEPERRHVIAHYETLAFDFEKIDARDLRITVEWSCDELLGHMRTWSALQKMMKQEGDAAFVAVSEQIAKAWGDTKKRECIFPIFLKIGRVVK
jgi:ubiquinone/menaquinone biosynthesis C-methylase UbiE